MASIGNRNKDINEKEEIKWTEDTIQKVLRYGFLSPNSIINGGKGTPSFRVERNCRRL